MRKLFYSTALCAVLFATGANAQQAAGVNSQTPPPIGQFGCPVIANGVICAAPGALVGPPTGDGSLGVARLWSRSTLTAVAPTISACGTSPTIITQSSDMLGQFTTGTGTVTSCTITFGKPFSGATVSVFLSQRTGTAVAATATANASGFTITFASSAPGDVWQYLVIGFES